MDITENSERWVGRTAFDADGFQLGKIDAIYHDDQTGLPEWVAFKSAKHDRLVPLAGATTHRRPDEDYDADDLDQAEDLRLAFGAQQIDSAPEFELGDDDHLDAEVEARLYQHFGVTRTASTVPRLRRYGRIGDSYA